MIHPHFSGRDTSITDPVEDIIQVLLEEIFLSPFHTPEISPLPGITQHNKENNSTKNYIEIIIPTDLEEMGCKPGDVSLEKS